MMIFVDQLTGSIVEVNEDCFVVAIDQYSATTDEEMIAEAVLHGTKVSDLIASHFTLQQNN